MKVISKGWKNWKFWYAIVCMPCLLRLLGHSCTTTSRKCVPCNTFFRNHKPNCVTEMTHIAICKTCQFISFQENINFHFVPFGVLLQNTYLEHNTSCPSKGCLVDDRNVRKSFSDLDLTIICIKPFSAV